MVQVPDFDRLYRHDDDPWQVATSFYERRKRAVVLASLTRESYRAAWDPACGTGELAANLATRADTVLATDSSAEAIRLTASRCADLAPVAVRRIRQPAAPEIPADGFDLVVIAEFAYYLPADHRAALWQLLDRVSGATAEIAIVHWRHRPHDGYLSGRDVNVEAVRRLTGAAAGWLSAVRHDDRDFVLDVLVREPTVPRGSAHDRC